MDKSYIDRIGTIEENIMSMTVLLEATSFHYNGVKRFVHISTGSFLNFSKISKISNYLQIPHVNVYLH